MKTITVRHIITGFALIFLVACSTRKNNFISRNSHALSTKYNILYNGGLAFDKGIADLKVQYQDNFWQILPIERMVPQNQGQLPGETRNTNFERAEEKAIKAIQKHSMNIEGSEKNPQMDEAHLLLGKARYFDQRFVPALEAFNYVLYKYPGSDKIYEVKIWREKTNMRLDNDLQAVTNLRKLLKEIKFKDQIFADANAAMTQAFLNIGEKDSAVAKLKLARDFTKDNEEKARYRFILGQLYEEIGQNDSAYIAYQEVIDMHRKSPRMYVIQAHARQARQFDPTKEDTVAFLKKYANLLKDRENRPHLDVLHHQMGLFYEKVKKPEKAVGFYNKSLNTNSKDTYLTASNYRNLADIYFKKAKYVTAGKYYDSTLAVLEPRTREHKLITKKRDNLEDVIKYEGIAQRNDSILKLVRMSDAEKQKYFGDMIQKQEELDLKAKEEAAKASEKEGEFILPEGVSKQEVASSKPGEFYFYNPSTVAYGREQFQKKWGKRALGPNWRYMSAQGVKKEDYTEDGDTKDGEEVENGDKKITPDFYIKQLPSAQKDIDSLTKERNFANYQLGVIYKEKFKEYRLAADKLENLLDQNPEERLVLPSLYNLYKIYQQIDASKAEYYKKKIIGEFPSSRYAQILNDNKISLDLGDPETVYKKLFKDYEDGLYRETLVKTDMAIVEYAGEETLPKFELLKANLIGKLHGLDEYKKALNFVALTYPNSQEGKETEKFIAAKIPLLEALYFNDEVPTSWKLIYQPKTLDANEYKTLLEKLSKLAKERTIEKLSVSVDVYTLDKNLIVLHGITSEENAKGLAQVLKEFKEYKVQETATVISSENYKVVQVYKALDEYIAGKGPHFEPKPKPEITIPKDEVIKEKPKAVREQKPEDPKENPNVKNQPVKGNGKDTDTNANGVPPSSAFPPAGNLMPPSGDDPGSKRRD